MSSTWLYQMVAGQWPESQYREAVWEGTTTLWPIGTVSGPERPAPGDRLIAWYAKTGSEAPGLYGWGVITSVDADSEEEELVWRPVSPSDYLKMNPMFDDATNKRISTIRGRFAQRTMWPIKKDDATWLGDRLRGWLGAV